MDLVIGTERARVNEQDLLGVGGEARVFRWKDQAVKVFHPVDRRDPKAAALRQRKLEKLERFPAGLPPEVVAPRALARTPRGEVVGYAMPLVRGAADVHRLGQRSFREGGYSSERVIEFFRALLRVLGEVHARGVVVGDLNDGNVLFQATQPFLIDADSVQFGAFECPVAHERFLDPRLFGVDLAAAPAFTPDSDWYAFNVLLFSSLLYVHPYGGVHKSLPTMLRRAQGRHSVLRPDVAYPRGAAPSAVLGDALLAHFEAVFDRDARGPFPQALLSSRWSVCGCGLEHARARCPRCALPGKPKDATRVQGRCTARRLFRTSGRILAAAVQGRLRYAYEEQGKVLREDGSTVLSEVPRGAELRLAGSSTWVVGQGRLAQCSNGQVTLRSTSGAVHDRTTFACSSQSAYRSDGGWLEELHSGARVGQVLEGQTWLWAGERLGFGFYRPGLFTVFFVLRHGRAGLTPVALPPLEGRVVEANAVFDDEHVLFSVALDKDGRRVHALSLVRADGTVLGTARGEPDSSRLLASPYGLALLGGRIVCATDEGLLSVRCEDKALVEGTLFTDTAPFVAAGQALLPAPGGAVYVVGPQEITQLSLS